ncbi:restriction endonuclease subunit S [Lentilactobacillus senioris]|uniref:restriction endonuclease subunit S n=1 Tax=Lentilactobacillus senioris TaxID=931534 RepID=UPI00227E7CC5|nr:restriction endonuclease subunit S [Lentilactobacillus senioris]MCY9806426.1 restriction endonuclease subunit S [Lentilactobacillus senioris]
MDEKMTPRIRFKGFQDDWERRKLGEVSKYSNGGSYENDVVENGTYELITLKSVNMSGKLVSSGKFINRETKTLEKDTLVMILSEQAPGLLGMTAKIPENNRYVLNQRVAEIKPNTNIDSYFLSMSINRSQAYFSKRGAGTKVQNISKPNVENFEFYCPSEREQQKIGSFFKHLDDTIALHQRKLAKLKELKQGYLQKLFPKNGSKFPQLRFAGFADAWERRKLGEVGKIIKVSVNPQLFPNNIFFEYSMPAYDKNQEPEVVLGKVMRSNRIGISGEILLVNKLNVRKKRIWLVHVKDKSSVASEEFIPYRSLDVDLNFLKQIMLSDKTTIKLESISSGTSNSQKRITPNDFLNYHVCFPESKKEQLKVGMFLKSIDSLIASNQQHLNQLKTLKKYLMQNMFV